MIGRQDQEYIDAFYDCLNTSLHDDGAMYCEVEFRADFHNLAKRVLRPFEYWIFQKHYVGGVKASKCAKSLKVTHPTFCYYCKRIEIKLGRACKTTKPFPLHPPYEYKSHGEDFAGHQHSVRTPRKDSRVPE